MSIKTDIQDRQVATEVYPIAGTAMVVRELMAACDAAVDDGQAIPPEGGFSQAFKARLESIQQAARLERTPIVGVCGTLNSGKSTVVAGFLSEAGSRRVLVGQLAKEGTHRFVFWLPESWRGNGLGAVVEEMIKSQTGAVPEMLSDNRDEAAAQYNAACDRVRQFNIPLVAYDPALDVGGIALLDCPDIQRSLDESVSESTAHLRLERLQTIAPLCSAFVVVASMQQAGDEDIGKVFGVLDNAASRAPLYFVLNMTDGDDVEIYRPEAQQVLDRWQRASAVRRIYLAPYAHREDRSIPARPVITSMDVEQVALNEVARELDPAALQKSHYASCVASLKSLLQEVKKRVTETAKAESDRANEARERICQFLAGKFVDDQGGLRSLCYDQAAKRLAESIQRTAPLTIRVAQTPTNFLRGLLVKLRKRDATEADVERYAQVKSVDFALFLLGSRFMPPQAGEDSLKQAWETALTVVKKHAGGAFGDADALDAMTRKMWDEVPFYKRFALYGNILLAMTGLVAASFLLPFDGGMTVVVWAKYHIILGGSEIFGILVGGPLIGVIASTPGAKALVERFEREVARPQLDILYAALADGIGIPRYLDGPPGMVSNGVEAHRFKEVDLPTQENRVKILRAPLIRLNEPAWAGMMQDLEKEEA